MTSKQRSSAAVHWLKTYDGKNVVKGYAKWFGVDKLCAIAELRLVGVNISEEYEAEVKRSIQDIIIQRKKAKEKRALRENGSISEDSFWDSEFEFIAGYTSGGFPYGIRKDELL